MGTKKEQLKLGVEYNLEENEPEEPDGSGVPRERKKKLKVLGSTWGSGEVKITRVEMINSDGQPAWTFNTGEPVTIRYHFYAFEEIVLPIFGMNIHRLDGVYVFGTNNFNIHPCSLATLNGQGFVDFHIKNLNLHSGTYFLTANVYLKPDEPFWSEPADFHHQMYEFKVWSGQPQHGIVPLDGQWQVGVSEELLKQGVVPGRLDFSSDGLAALLCSGWHDLEEIPASEEQPSYRYAWAGSSASFLIHVSQEASSLFMEINGNVPSEIFRSTSAT